MYTQTILKRITYMLKYVECMLILENVYKITSRAKTIRKVNVFIVYCSNAILLRSCINLFGPPPCPLPCPASSPPPRLAFSPLLSFPVPGRPSPRLKTSEAVWVLQLRTMETAAIFSRARHVHVYRQTAKGR